MDYDLQQDFETNSLFSKLNLGSEETNASLGASSKEVRIVNSRTNSTPISCGIMGSVTKCQTDNI